MKERKGQVFLVGAGCGEADLITLRGLALLQSCDVVVYDDLIAEELLDAAPESAQRIYMGKRNGCHSAAQEAICALLIEKAREGKTVVRLKGGDPCVFGRGGEEALALRDAGISYRIVPGISSAIAIPEEAGIPVTHRGVSRSIHIITAHTADTPDGLPEDLEALARLSGTLVFLMGLRRLDRLARRLTEGGMASDTPVAVVSGGCAPSPCAVRGTLADIAKKAAHVQPPAVIVVGDVAGMDISAPSGGPLQGVCVALTGTDAVTEKLRKLLRSQGARTFLAARAVVEPLPMEEDLPALLDDGPWLVFTSANGVWVFFEELKRRMADLRRLRDCRFAVIGAATGAALSAYGFYADLCPKDYTCAALARALLNTVPEGETILLLRSEMGGQALPKTLESRYAVRDIPLYTISPDRTVAERAARQIDRADFLVFSSAGGVRMYFDTHGKVPEGTVCVCIGDVTADELRDRWDGPILTASETSAQGVAETIIRTQKGKICRAERFS